MSYLKDKVKKELLSGAKKEAISNLTTSDKDLTKKQQLEKGLHYLQVIFVVGWNFLIFGTTDEINDIDIYFGFGGALFLYFALGIVGKKGIKQKFPD